MRISGLLVSAALLLASSTAQAATFRFESDPFAGSSALITPGRQVVGGELFIPNFSIAGDDFSFDPVTFGVSNQLAFFNGQAVDLPTGGLNVIVLQTTDNDNNPATPFGATSAADLIAAEIDDFGPGFFIYHNSGLNLNRLVYSTDLSSSAADLKIIARLTNPVGQAAIDALPTFTRTNFDLTPVPEPTLTPVMGLIAACFGWLALKRRQQTTV